MLRVQNVLCAVVLVALIATSAGADNWAQWRGPGSAGVAPAGTFPTTWSATENVAWKVDLPGRGASTPVVWEDSIFVSCASGDKNALLCFDRQGKKRWETTFGQERPGKNRKATGSNPSPTTDGELVYVYFKNGDFACVDFDGKVVWQKNLQDEYGKDTLWWDLGTSPVLTRDLVVVACMQSGPSYLAGFDKKTGDVVWKVDRMLDAPVESAQSYTTPVVLDEDGKETIIVLGADHVTAHDAASGEELWRAGGLNPGQDESFRSIASPVVVDGLVIAPYARGDTLTAIRLGGSGDVTLSNVAWVLNDAGADVPTPAVANGKIYVCRDNGEVVCLDAKSGERLWGERVERHRESFSSSPMLAGGNIYVTREDGKTFVLEQGDAFRLVAANELGEQTVATPVFTDGKILIRTMQSLYCIGGQ
jgi:outer membrane protein assembly factor BamB